MATRYDWYLAIGRGHRKADYFCSFCQVYVIETEEAWLCHHSCWPLPHISGHTVSMSLYWRHLKQGG